MDTYKTDAFQHFLLGERSGGRLDFDLGTFFLVVCIYMWFYTQWMVQVWVGFLDVKGLWWTFVVGWYFCSLKRVESILKAMFSFTLGPYHVLFLLYVCTVGRGTWPKTKITIPLCDRPAVGKPHRWLQFYHGMSNLMWLARAGQTAYYSQPTSRVELYRTFTTPLH